MTAVMLRLLLFSALGVGVIGMHTIGHSTDHHVWMAPTVHGTSDVTGVSMADRVMQPQVTGAEPCDGDCGAHGALAMWAVSGSHPLPGGAGLWTACLAVLFGAGLLALLSHVLARAGPVPRSALPGGTRLLRARFALLPRFPLRLVDVAVLRI